MLIRRTRVSAAPILFLLMVRSPGACAADVSFMHDVAPILLTRCVGCHGPTKMEGDLRLHTFAHLQTPSASGLAAVVAGVPDDSELFVRITDGDEAVRMPQLDDPLSPQEIAVIRQWIEAGAEFDGDDPAAPFKSQMPPREHPAAPAAYPLPVPVYALAFSPDGSELSVSGYREITVWNPESGELLRRIGGLPQRIQGLEYYRDGQKLLVGGGDPGEYGEVCEVDLTEGKRIRVYGTWGDLVLAVDLSADQSRVLATSADRSVRCYSTADGSRLWESMLHSDWVTCGAFSCDGRFVATGDRNFTIKVLDAATGELFTTYKGHQRNLGPETGRFAIYALTFDDDSPLAFSAGEGKSIRVWEPEKAKQEDGSAADMEIRFYKKGHTEFLRHGSAHPVFGLVARGDDLFAATGDGFVKQFNIATLEPVRDYIGHHDWVFAVDAHPASQRVASGAFDGEVRVWNTQTGELVTHFTAAPGLTSPR